MARVAILLLALGAAVTQCRPSGMQSNELLAALLLIPAKTYTYNVEFESTWSATTHGTGLGFPSNAHFSTLVGMTHPGGHSHWSSGAISTNGMESMAEMGRTAILQEEFNALSGTESFRGSPIFSPGKTSFNFSTDDNRTHITLVTMVAPSPDWFVGVSNLPLYEAGAWASRKVVSLIVYDAGTDSGATFTAADIDTNPRVPIQPLAVDPFYVGGQYVPIGTFTFTRLN
ncbi:MAG: spondin domain-containing protein [Leptospirales bacterium]|nr:spondin domain-containing protein [Leptospirales bacterium]